MLSRKLLTPSALALLILAASFPAARGQRLEDGEVEFSQKARKSTAMRRDLFSGSLQVDPKNKEHLEAIDLYAKSVTYPLYWRTQSRLPKDKDGEISGYVDSFQRELATLVRVKATTQVLQPIYCKFIIERAQEVAEKGKPIAALNAARILSRIVARRVDRDFLIPEKEWAEETLPRLADGTGEALANACVTLIEDPKGNDGSRYYLFQALADLLAMNRPANQLVKPETVEKVCAAAAKVVEKAVPFPKATPRSEVEGYRMMRQQAVKALAQARVPAAGKQRPALVLARVAASDSTIAPAPSIGERIEAVVGLGQMGAAKSPDFLPDYAAAQMCRGVIDFGNEASANLDSKAIVRLRPWKVDAGRMIEAVELLRADVKVPYVQEAMKQCLAVLTPLEQGRAAPANDLNDWLVRNEPASKTLFRGEGGSVVKPTAKAK